MDIYLKGIMNKVRFSSVQGNLTMENLFQLHLTTVKPNTACLQEIATNIHTEQQKEGEVDFVGTGTPKNAILSLKMEIIKDIIAIKKQINADLILKRSLSDKKQKALIIRAEREDGKMETLSDKELDEIINS